MAGRIPDNGDADAPADALARKAADRGDAVKVTR